LQYAAACCTTSELRSQKYFGWNPLAEQRSST
jgi:hypothetical protein